MILHCRSSIFDENVSNVLVKVLTFDYLVVQTSPLFRIYFCSSYIFGNSYFIDIKETCHFLCSDVCTKTEKLLLCEIRLIQPSLLLHFAMDILIWFSYIKLRKLLKIWHLFSDRSVYWLRLVLLVYTDCLLWIYLWARYICNSFNWPFSHIFLKFK